jgi:arabinogalactan endo-1,4-beta-galactosidase
MKIQAPLIFVMLSVTMILSCKDDTADNSKNPSEGEFFFGADLSNVNQVLDHQGVYRDNGVVSSPYKIFKDHGTDVVRLRLWHNPQWTKGVYGNVATQMYNDLADVSKSISLAKAQGMAVLLDLHYSDTWADPGKQEIPQAWREIQTIEVLGDSVYQYTSRIFQTLATKGLIPEFVQIGNETNCGMLFTNSPEGFPSCNVCEGNWDRMGSILRRAISAVRASTELSSIKTKVILHVADPKNVEWWFDNITSTSGGNVTDFDIIGMSYYPLWHTTVGIDQLSDNIKMLGDKFGRPVMILETAYPWTTEANDEYNNLFGDQIPLNGFPFTEKGQNELLVKFVQEVRDGGGLGVFYWEPAWISSEMKDLWGSGSSWENCTFFDFEGNTHQGIEFMNYEYK